MPISRLLVIGELNVDLILNQIQGHPEVGKEILASQMNLVMGSSSAITAANCASLGVPTSFCGKIGNDQFGDFLIDALTAKQVDTRFITSDSSEKTGVTVVLNYAEDRANVTYCGAMNSLTYKDIPWHDIKQFGHLHLSNFFIQKGLQPDILQIFRKAKENGLTTSLDLQWDPSEMWDFDFKACLPYVDVFMPNTSELLALTKTKTVSEGIETIKPFANLIVIKMGADGSMGISKSETIEMKAYQNLEVIDAIGAGDSFNSGFLKGYLEGKTLAECLSIGNLMGALNTTAAGGTAAFENKEKIKENVKVLFDADIEL